MFDYLGLAYKVSDYTVVISGATRACTSRSAVAPQFIVHPGSTLTTRMGSSHTVSTLHRV